MAKYTPLSQDDESDNDEKKYSKPQYLCDKIRRSPFGILVDNTLVKYLCRILRVVPSFLSWLFMGRAKQFRLLLWKNFVIQRRHPLAAAVQLTLPFVLAMVLTITRLKADTISYEGDTNLRAFSLDECSLNPITPLEKQEGLRIAFAPRNPIVDSIMIEALRMFIQPITMQGFTNEQDVLDFYAQNVTDGHDIGAVIFLNVTAIDDLKGPFSYKLRLPQKPQDNILSPPNRFDTGLTYPPVPAAGPRAPKDFTGGPPGYCSSGFLTIQHTVAMAVGNILNHTAADIPLSNITVRLKRFPYPPYMMDYLGMALKEFLPLLLMLSFLYPAFDLVKSLVLEKEKKLKESMKIMGLTGFLHWSSWFTKAFIFFGIDVILITFLLCFNFGKVAVLIKSDASLIFVFLLLYIISGISFCLMLSTFFSTANSAATAGGIIWFLSYMPYFFIGPKYTTIAFPLKMLASLLCNTCMAFGGMQIFLNEGAGYGLQWQRVNVPTSPDDPLTMAIVMVMLSVDTVLYLLITWYVDNVYPGEFGMPQPWYFPFQPTYWCPHRLDRITKQLPTSRVDNDFFEEEPADLTPGISICGVTKVYGPKVAVNNLNLKIYHGQITVLLGHNGAGKTTTMSILTGLFPPSRGTAFINGYDIVKDSARVRTDLGLCPQHDVIFDDLTVAEHLYFSCQLKDVDRRKIQDEINEMLVATNLLDKRDTLSAKLSGGMKRRLCVGMALVGKPKVVMMDEPTSGMDPASRRFTWNLLQSLRKTMTILLSTHFMDEADILGDRIAIMADGELQCCGSPMFLKKKYGAGYHMVIVKKQDCDPGPIKHLVTSIIPKAEVESNIGAELSFVLPHKSSSKFPRLFGEIESQKERLKICSYGASVTTMEEVFLKVGLRHNKTYGAKLHGGNHQNDHHQDGHHQNGHHPNGHHQDSHHQNGHHQDSHHQNGHHLDIHKQNGHHQNSHHQDGHQKDHHLQNGNHQDGHHQKVYHEIPSGHHNESANAVSNIPSIDGKLSKHRVDYRNKGMTLLLQQIKAMIIKKMLHTKRNWILTFVQLMVPIIVLILALFVLNSSSNQPPEPALILNLKPFGKTRVPYACTGERGNNLCGKYIGQFADTIDKPEKVPGTTKDITNYLLNVAKNGTYAYNTELMIGATFNGDQQSNTLDACAMFNNQPYHTPAIGLSALDTALLRYLTGYDDIKINVINHPLPTMLVEQVGHQRKAGKDRMLSGALGVDLGMSVTQQEEMMKGYTTSFQISFNMMFGISFLVSSFVIFLVKEKSTDAKHLQFVSGVRAPTFWVANFIWDFVNYIVPCFLMMLVFVSFRQDGYSTCSLQGCLLLIFVLYGWSVLPFTYLLSFAFKIASTAYARIAMFNIFSGVVPLIVVSILFMINDHTREVKKVLDWVFLALPNYCLGAAIKDIYLNFYNRRFCEQYSQFSVVCNCEDWYCFRYTDNYLSWKAPGIGRELFFLSLWGLVYLLIVMMLEMGLGIRLTGCLFNIYWSKRSKRLRPKNTEEFDDDVLKEDERINKTDMLNLFITENLVVKNLGKFYGLFDPFMAVEHVSVGVPRGECFGLLGINGAGKTTTFKMLTGDEALSTGDAFIEGFSIQKQITEVRKRLGYCPQFDAVIDQMTGRETLFMFGRLRGIPEKELPKLVTDLSNSLLFAEHIDKLVKNYSGGNKRKLSTAVALIGNPPIVFLDEPTTGMDPMARRMVWDTISRVRDSGCSIILTSHSMEECDALCTRLAIMVSGRFKCLGSPQHLKNKFGKGFTLTAKIQQSALTAGHLKQLTAQFQAFLVQNFPGCVAKDLHQGMVHYHIPANLMTWAEMFSIMENAKGQFFLEDYAVGQTTLEQIFLGFTKKQKLGHVEE